MDNNKANGSRSIRDLIYSTRRTIRMRDRLEAAGVVTDSDAEAITISGNTYAIKGALKSSGFRWVPGRKVWRYELRTYSNFKMSHGGSRLQDCTVTRNPFPADWYTAACRLIAA